MEIEYPYMTSNNKIEPIMKDIQKAAKPPKFTVEFLRHLGYTSSNDRAIIPLLKKLGFLGADGVPTEYYDKLRDATESKNVLGERIKDLYTDVFKIDTEIYKRSDEDIKGAFARVTGKDAKSVGRYFSTFKTICGLANFAVKTTPDAKEKKVVEKREIPKPEVIETHEVQKRSSQFHYNIQIHLPATTDISVYNAIFRSLRENLLI